jgi:predicted DNA-binding transcriptional regulator YafY
MRTVQRDLNALSAVFPLIGDDGKPQGWSWAFGAPQIDLPALDEAAALTFSLAKTQLDQVLPKSTVSFLEPWFKAAQGVLKGAGRHGKAVDQKIRVIPRSLQLLPAQIAPQIQTAIYEGVISNTQIEVQYQSRTKKELRTYRVHPLGLVIADSVCYLVCTIDEHQDPRLLALHRIMRANNTDTAAKSPKGFNLDEYLAGGETGILRDEIPMKLEFLMRNTWASHLAETPLNSEQTMKQINDEWTKVTATVANTSQLRWWLRSFGPDLEVIRPASLRREFYNENLAVTNLYKDRTEKRRKPPLTETENLRQARERKEWERLTYKNDFQAILATEDCVLESLDSSDYSETGDIG